MDRKRNLVNGISFFVIPLFLTGIIIGELLIWGYYDPIDSGLKILVSFLVVLATGAIAMLIFVASLPSFSEESGKEAKSAKGFTIASIVLGVSAMLQFMLIVLMYVWRLVVLLAFLIGLLFRYD